MGKKSKKKGGATNKAARKEKLQERREQQLEEVDNNQGSSTDLAPRQYFENDRVWFYPSKKDWSWENTSPNTYRGIVKHVNDGKLDIIPFQSKIDCIDYHVTISVDDAFPDFCDMTLRFDVGDRVLCGTPNRGWVAREVRYLWPIAETFHNYPTSPQKPDDIVDRYKCGEYGAVADDNNQPLFCSAPNDEDYCIMKHPSSFRFGVGDNVIFYAYAARGIGRSVSQLKKITDNYPWTWVEGRVKSVDIIGMEKYAAYTCLFEAEGTTYSCFIREDNDELIAKENANARDRLFDAIEQDCSRDHIMYLTAYYEIDIMAFRDMVVSKAIEYASYQALSWLQHECNIDMINLKDEQENNLLHKIASSEHAMRFIREAGRLCNMEEPPDWKLNLTDFDAELINGQNKDDLTWLQILVKRGDVKALDAVLSPHCGLAWELALNYGISDNGVSLLNNTIQEVESGEKKNVMQQVVNSFASFRTLFQQCKATEWISSSNAEEDLFKRDSMHLLQGTDAPLNAKRLTRFFNDWQGYNKSFLDDNPFRNLVGRGYFSLFKLLYETDETAFIHKEYSLWSQEDMNQYIQPELLVDWEEAPFFRDADIWTACTIGNNGCFHAYDAKDHIKRHTYLRSIRQHVLSPEHPSLLSFLQEKAEKKSQISSVYGGAEAELAKHRLSLLQDDKTLEGRLMILDYLLQHNPTTKLNLEAIEAIRHRQCGVLRFMVDKGLVKMEANASSNRVFTKVAPNLKCLEKGRIPSSMTAASFLSFIAVGKFTFSLIITLCLGVSYAHLPTSCASCSYHVQNMTIFRHFNGSVNHTRRHLILVMVGTCYTLVPTWVELKS